MPDKQSTFAPTAMLSGMGEFAHDLVTLAELQWELLKADSGDLAKQWQPVIIAMAVAFVLALGCTPVVLLAIAWRFVAAGMSHWLAHLLAAAIGITGVLLLIGFAWSRFKRLRPAMMRSREELANNVAWFKDAVNQRNGM